MLHVVYPAGCTSNHHARWQWNGSLESPTVSPSVLVTYSHAGVEKVCHSFINDGVIQYLSDCTHHLAGKTVPLPCHFGEDEWLD